MPDPSYELPREQAHDVLAAEAFALPGPDPELFHETVVLPEDPSGISDAHDVLAAEEFAMPAPSSRRGAARATLARGADSPLRAAIALAGGLMGLLALRRRHR